MATTQLTALAEHKKALRRRVDGVDLEGPVNHAEVLRLIKAVNNDGWMSAMTGLGVPGRDKRTTGRLEWNGLLFTEHKAESIVAGSNLARRIVEHLPYEATRKGIKLKGFDDEDTSVQDAMDELSVRDNFFQAWAWGRQYGGAALLMMTDEPEENLETPLWLIKRDGTKRLNPAVGKVKNLVPLNRWELTVWSTDIDTDLTSPNFRKPKFYRLNAISGGLRVPIDVKIHYSRIIRFDGLTLGPLLFMRNGYWHDSIFSGLLPSMRDYDMSHEGIAQVLGEFRFIIHKMPDLAEMVADGKNSTIQKRVAAGASARTTTGVMMIDGAEDVTALSETFGGVDAMLDRLANKFAANTEYPKIVLFNESPEGSMGGNGSSEMDIWYNTVESRQATYLSPKLDQFLEVFFAAPEGPTKGKPPEDWGYEFPPLSQETAGEKATRQKTEAETDDIYVTMGVKDEVAVMQDRFPELLEGQDPETMRAQIEAEKQKQMALQQEQAAAGADPNAPPKKKPPQVDSDDWGLRSDDDEGGRWVTVNGNPVLVGGEVSAGEAAARTTSNAAQASQQHEWIKAGNSKTSTSAKNPFGHKTREELQHAIASGAKLSSKDLKSNNHALRQLAQEHLGRV